MTRKLSGPIDGDMITREFFPMNVNKPEFINYGDCMKWAYIAHALYEGVELYSNKHHAFVKQGGKFYDSESPNGTRDWVSMGCNSRMFQAYHYDRTDSGIKPKKQDMGQFQTRWGWVEWDILDKKIRAFWRRHNEKNKNKNLNVAA